MNLTDFTNEANSYLRWPWKFTDRKMVAASDARILLARSLKSSDKYEEATPEVQAKFARYFNVAHGSPTISVSAAKLTQWAGTLRVDEDKRPLMIPGYFMGVIFNRSQVARAFKLVDDRTFSASIISFSDMPGKALLLTGKKWRVILMCCKEGALHQNDLKKGQPIRTFQYA